MAREIDFEKKRTIIQLYLDGQSYSDISDKTDVSTGAISGIVTQFNEGHGIEPQSGLLSQEIRSIAGMIREKHLSIPDMERRVMMGNIAISAGFSPETLMKIVSRLKGKQDTDLDQYPRVIDHILSMESKNSLSVGELEDKIATRYVGLEDVTENLKNKRNELSDLLKSLGEESEKSRTLSMQNELLERIREITGISSGDKILEILNNLRDKGFSAGIYLEASDIIRMMHEHNASAEEVFASLDFHRSLKDVGLDRKFLDHILENDKIREIGVRRCLELTLDYMEREDEIKKNILADLVKSKDIGDNIEKKTREIQDLNSKLENAGSELRDLEARKVEMDRIISQYEKVLGHFSSIEEMTVRQKKLKMSYDMVSTKLQSDYSELKDRKEELARINNQVLERSAEASSYENGISDLKSLDKAIKEKQESLESLQSQYDEMKDKIDTGMEMFSLITTGSLSEFYGIERICKNIMDAKGERYRYQEEELRERSLKALISLSRYGVVGLKYTSGRGYGIEFVDKEIYDSNLKNFNNINSLQISINSAFEKLGSDVTSSIRSMMNTEPKPTWLIPLISKSVEKIIDDRLKAAEDAVKEMNANVLEGMLRIYREDIYVSVMRNNGTVEVDRISRDNLRDSIIANRPIPVGDFSLPLCETIRSIILQMAGKKSICVRESPPLKIARET